MTLIDATYAHPRPASEVIPDGLLQQVIRLASQDSPRGLVIAMTSVDPQSQVMLLAEMLAEELGSDNGGNVLCLDSRALTAHAAQPVKPVEMPVRPMFAGQDKSHAPIWHDGPSRLRASIDALRDRYQYSLIACPAVKSSPDVLALSSLVDGILVVVQANRTRLREIELMENTIVSVRGTIIGHILDKRAYFIPAWLYELLAKFGI